MLAVDDSGFFEIGVETVCMYECESLSQLEEGAGIHIAFTSDPRNDL